MRNSPKLLLSLAVLSALIVALLLWFPSDGINPADAAMAEYQIDKMTCGSCVGNIEKALSGLDGVGSVEINLTSNRGRVTFDPAEIDSETIAAAISEAGYPASLRLQLDPAEHAALKQEQSQLGQQYLARIGGRLLSRDDFDQQVRQRSNQSSADVSTDQLRSSVWQDVLQRELLLSAADQNQVVVQGGEVDLRLEQLRQGHQGLEQIIAQRYGDMQSFRQRLREDMIINRNLEDHVYPGLVDPAKRQEVLQQWYAQLQKGTEVIIFDPQLKSISAGGSGCACCNS